MVRDRCVEELFLERFNKQAASFKKRAFVPGPTEQDVYAQQEQLRNQQVQSDENKKKIASDLVATLYSWANTLQTELNRPEIVAVANMGSGWYIHAMQVVQGLQTMGTNLDTIVQSYDSTGNMDALQRTYNQEVTPDMLLQGHGNSQQNSSTMNKGHGV